VKPAPVMTTVRCLDMAFLLNVIGLDERSEA
jgi:hypothetical protein